MNKTKIEKRNYNKFVFKAPLAIESYCDTYDIDDNDIIKEMYLTLKEYHNLEKLLINKRNELVEKLQDVISFLGDDKFTIYDDGGVEYNERELKEDN